VLFDKGYILNYKFEDTDNRQGNIKIALNTTPKQGVCNYQVAPREYTWSSPVQAGSELPKVLNDWVLPFSLLRRSNY